MPDYAGKAKLFTKQRKAADLFLRGGDIFSLSVISLE